LTPLNSPDFYNLLYLLAKNANQDTGWLEKYARRQGRLADDTRKISLVKAGGRQLKPFPEGQRGGAGERLNAKVVGAGGVMLADTISDCIEITPGDLA
jgi:hypothetical protein